MNQDSSLASPRRVAIYARVSTDKQRDSLESQKHRCHGWLQSQGYAAADLDQVHEFVDEGYSGEDTNRPAFQEMLEAVTRDEVDCIVFSELSRVSRNTRDFLALYEQLHDCRTSLVALRENIETHTPHGRLIATILSALSQFEHDQTEVSPQNEDQLRKRRNP